MYYYILDLGNKEVVKIKEKMEMTMASYGISGDFGKISPLSSAFELAKRAQDHNYTTIVAIGGSEIINQVIQAVVGTDTVLGIIPINAPKRICGLIGADNYKTALDNLRARKIENFDMGKIAEAKYFLTEARIKNPRPIKTVLDFGEFKAKGNFKDIVIGNGTSGNESFRDGFLNIRIDQKETKSSFLGFFKKSDTPFSSFRADKLNIDSEEQINILVDEEVAAKTPCEIKLLPFALKLIVAKDS